MKDFRQALITRRTKGDIIFDFVNNTLLFLILLIVIYPLYFIVIASFSNPVSVASGEVILKPLGATLEGYKRIFHDSSIWIGYKNSLIYTILGTALNIILTMMLSYPLSRRDFSGRKVLMLFLMITMYFSGGLIPTYLIVKKLGLVNNWMVMILLGAVSVYNVIITRSFIQANIPEELYEAASIDGCSHFRYFAKVILPLSKPIIAVLVLYYGVGHWNQFFSAMIYLRNEKLYPLQLILRSILVQNQSQDKMMQNVENMAEEQLIADLIKYGVIIVASVPVLAIYPFLQKYFVKGVMIGAVKG